MLKKSFVEWLDSEEGYWVRDTYDLEKGAWIGRGKLQLTDDQRKILDEAVGFDENGKLKYETVLYSTIKKSGKTALGAAVGCWYAENGPPGTEIFVLANDLDSAEGRLMRDIKYHFEQRIANRELFDTGERVYRYTTRTCKITQYRIELPNGTFIQAVAQSYRSVAGARQALTLWDELWGYTSELSRRTWDELTPIPTVENSLRFISTYAGFENESDLLWDLYLKGVGAEEHQQGKGETIKGLEDYPCWKNGEIFTYWCHEPTMPWQTPEYYEKQMSTLRPSAYIRLHENRWVTSQEAFIPVEWYDEGAKKYEAPAELWSDHPFRHWPVVIGVDAGIKRDSTAVVGVAFDQQSGVVGQLFHRIWTPSEGDPVDLDITVERTILELRQNFNIAAVVYDPQHIIQTMLRLKNKGINTFEFTQSVRNMTAASQLLYDLFKYRKYHAYRDDDVRRHIQMAMAETSSKGFRIVKNTASRRAFVDCAIAMAMASYVAVTNGGVDISVPVIVESPYSDATAMQALKNKEIPFELRTEDDYI